jgi:Flp pilus assembly protein TadG
VIRLRAILRFARARDGNSAIEFAIVAPVFLALMLGTMEFARLFWTQSTLQQAVQAAARCASVNTTTCDNATDTATYAANQMYGLSISSSVFTATLNTTCGSNTGNKVSASLAFTFIAKGLIPSGWNPTLTASSCFPLNQN